MSTCYQVEFGLIDYDLDWLIMSPNVLPEYWKILRCFLGFFILFLFFTVDGNPS